MPNPSNAFMRFFERDLPDNYLIASDGMWFDCPWDQRISRSPSDKSPSLIIGWSWAVVDLVIERQRDDDLSWPVTAIGSAPMHHSVIINQCDVAVFPSKVDGVP